MGRLLAIGFLKKKKEEKKEIYSFIRLKINIKTHKQLEGIFIEL